MAIGAILFAESFLEFLIFHFDHEGAGEDCEGREDPADGEGAGEAPGEHFAEVGEVDWMAHASAEAGCNQALFATGAEDFGQASKLGECEMST